MKLYDVTAIVILVCLAIGTIGVISAKYFGPDQVIEEVAEDIIEQNTKLKLDLTPMSPEL